jgi:hypothetical protein
MVCSNGVIIHKVGGFGFSKVLQTFSIGLKMDFSNWIGPSRPGMAWAELLAFLPLCLDGFDLLADA